MTEGVILSSIDSNIGLDAAGNLVLATKSSSAATPAAGSAGIVGPGIAYNFAISAGKSTSNICLVTFQLQDVAGNAVAKAEDCDIYLSDSSAGSGLTGTSASGTVGAGASGFVVGILTASKAFRAQLDSTGKFILSITDTAKTGFYPCVALAGKKVQVGAQLVTGNYG